MTEKLRSQVAALSKVGGCARRLQGADDCVAPGRGLGISGLGIFKLPVEQRGVTSRSVRKCRVRLIA